MSICHAVRRGLNSADAAKFVGLAAGGFLLPSGSDAHARKLSPFELGAVKGEGNCYFCNSKACPADLLPESNEGCNSIMLVICKNCFGGCLDVCQNFQTKFWCEFTGDTDDNCSISYCTQVCPPGDQMEYTADCFQSCVEACPTSCGYIRTGSCTMD